MADLDARRAARRAPGASRRERTRGGVRRRALDWMLLGAVARRSSRYGLWAIAGITRHDVPGDPTTTSSARRSSPPSALVDARRLAPRPGPLPPLLAHALRGSLIGCSCSCSSPAPRRAARSAGSTSALPVPAVGVREAAARRSFARRVPRASAAGGSARLRTVAHGDRRSPRCRSLLVFMQPDFGTALVYVAALAAVLFVAGTRWLHLGC